MSILSQYRHVHVVGAGGIGVSAAAKLLLLSGVTITGTDAVETEAVGELRAMGAHIGVGYAAPNLPADAEMILYTSAESLENPERAEAARRGLRQLSYFEFIGELSRERRTVAVSGTNGKSTTTAMLGRILEEAGMDPLVIVGSKVPGFPHQNLRPGNGPFVIEACEHQAHMLLLSPTSIVLTNIEADHLDYYRDLAHIRDTFQEYVAKVPAEGFVAWNAEDPQSATLALSCPGVTFGIGRDADVVARDLVAEAGCQRFVLEHHGERLGDVKLCVPGRFNVMNALAAATGALRLGVPFAAVQKSLGSFEGLWRRFERVGEKDGVLVVSDYGHHPTAVAETLAGARAFYPGRRIVLCFQPHHRNRTKNLFDEFVASFDGADVVLLPEIYDARGRERAEDADVSSEQLVAAVHARDAAAGRSREVAFVATNDAALAWLRAQARPGDVVLVMGAGHIYKIAPQLVGA
jgi:UDP-N-acetylmuramate--alanine ligase